MSKKRYSSKSSRGSSHQGQQKSTSTQQANYEDSLTAECLIRTFMEKGNMENPILKMIFIGGSSLRPKEGESESELLFRRMKNCWLEKRKNYGTREFLRAKLKECQLDSEVDSRWAKFSMMGPRSLLYQRFGSTTNKERKEDFQMGIFLDDWYLSDSAVRIQKYGQMKIIPEIVQANIIIHRWDQFPDRNPTVFHHKDRRTFHMIIDDLNILHHVNLFKNQIETLQMFYDSKNPESIQLMQQNWSKFICIARGKKKLNEVKERKQSRSNSVESSQKTKTCIHKQLKKRCQIKDSQKSRRQDKEKQKDNKEFVASSVWFVQNQSTRLIEDIAEIERALALAETVDDKDIDILPKDIFPGGIVRFVEEFGAGNYLKLFLKLIYEYFVSPTRKTQDAYMRDRAFEFEEIRKEIIKDFKFEKQAEADLNRYLLVELRLYHLGEWTRYFKALQQPKDEKKKILIKINKILRGFGRARLSIDQLMICPFCAKVWDKKEIFKHFSEISVGLMSKRGLRQ